MNINEAAWIQSSWMLNIKFQIAIFQKPFKIIWCGFRQSPPYWSALKYLVELKPLYLPFKSKNMSEDTMARASLGPWNFIRDMCSSNQWGLIKAPGQEANDDNSGIVFALLDNNGMLSVLIRIASMMRF